MPENTNISFVQHFEYVSRNHDSAQVWEDFVTISAFHLDESSVLESDRTRIISKYKKAEIIDFAWLLQDLSASLIKQPEDILGRVYNELNIDDRKLSHFIPKNEDSLLLVRTLFNKELKSFHKPIIKLNSPACLSGGMALAFAQLMRDCEKDPRNSLWVQCIDTNRLFVLMCYVQLSLLGIAAEVLLKDSYSQEVLEVLYTPAHNLKRWNDVLWSNPPSSDSISEYPRAKSYGREFDFVLGQEKISQFCEIFALF